MVLAILFLTAGVCPVQQQPVPSQRPAATVPGAPAPAATKPQEEDPALIRRLEEIDARAALITDLTADFEQKRSTPLLRKPLVSSGHIRVRGSMTRWDTVAPGPSVLTIDPVAVKIFYPEQRSLEIYSVSSGLARLAATPLPRLKTVREQFWISECKASDMDNVPTANTGSQVALLLLPKSDDLKKYVRQVRVLLDEPPKEEAGGRKNAGNTSDKHTYGVARQVEVTDADGDRTVVSFKGARINTGLTDADLELVVPEGTRISRPLDAAAAPNDPARKEKE